MWVFSHSLHREREMKNILVVATVDYLNALARGAVAMLFALAAYAATADEAGVVKTASGRVLVERANRLVEAFPGFVVASADRVTTGKDGKVGILLRDDTRLAIGPDSVLAIEQFKFDATTQVGKLDAFLKRGLLAVVSGKIAHHDADAVTFRTPTLILGVRGTEFILESHGEQ